VVTTVSSSSSNVPRPQHTCLHGCCQLPSLSQTALLLLLLLLARVLFAAALWVAAVSTAGLGNQKCCTVTMRSKGLLTS
jgi:hypothetical protein